MWFLFSILVAASSKKNSRLRDGDADEILSFDGKVVELHEPGDIDPWSFGAAHGLVHTVVQDTTAGDLRNVISKLMNICETRVPHICLGSHKATILQDAVASRANDKHGASGSLNVLELGAHSGDGTLHLLNHLPTGSTVVSVDPDAQDMSEGAKLVRHAISGLDLTYHPMVVDDDEAFDGFLDNMLGNFGISGFDIVMFDHQPHYFHAHLETLRKKKMLKPHARVIADNIMRHGNKVNAYVKAVSQGPFETKFHEVSRPYTDSVSVSKFVPRTDEL